jgi:hypothetical protein
MIHRARTFLAAALLVAAPAVAHAALSAYSQNFEGLLATSPSALSGNGWVVYGNVYTPAHVYMYGYGTFPAPNTGLAWSAVAVGQGGAEQGAQQLSVYSDYQNTDHAAGNLVESNVFREQTIAAGDLNTVWTFQFDAKLGNLLAPSTALAFIKTINPAAGYATTNFITVDMTAIPSTWGTYALSIALTAPALVGQIMQIGFSNTTTNYVASGVFYDNIVWSKTGTLGIAPAGPSVMELRPAAPNPFPASTRLDFTLAQAGDADLTVYDVGGRHVTTLFRGTAAAGPHNATWDGRFADGRLAPAGVYHAVLQTAAGRVTRNLVLAR